MMGNSIRVRLYCFMLLAVYLCTGAAAQKPTDVVVRMYNGRPTVFIDGKPDALPGYCPWYTKQFFDKFMAQLYRHDFGVYLLDLESVSGDSWGSRFWKGDTITSEPLQAATDLVTIDEQAEQIRKNAPDSYLIIRFMHRPPESWCTLHPAEFFIDEDGGIHDTPSLASDLFWEKASEFCAALVRYVESGPWADRVIGYMNIHLAEGVHIPVAEGYLYDHNPSMVQKWRQFLRNKYGTVEKLQASYCDSTAAFESMRIPKDRLRGPAPEASNILYWQNAAGNRGLRDYLELQRELFHRRFRQISAGMKKGADRNVLFMHDAMKQPMQGWNLFGFFSIGPERYTSWNPVFPELMAGSGSIGVADLFGTTPGFTGLITPHDYQARGLGGVYEPEGMADSAVLRGTCFWSEMDTRYCVNCRNDGSQTLGAAHTVDDWAALTWRNFASGWTRGFSSYWHHSWTVADDWFFSEDLHKVIDRQIEVIRESINWVHGDVLGIAMILDDSAVLETNGSGNYLNEAVMWEYKQGLARCGVPFRIYLFEDLALDTFPKHRVYYFPNLFRVDDDRLAQLRKKVFRDGTVVVWGPGSGISDGEKIGAEPAAKLTGFRFTVLPANAQRRILISNFDHPVTRGCDESLVIGGPLAYGPVLIPVDGVELGRAWTKGGMNMTGMSIKEFGSGAAGNGKGSYGEGDFAAIFTTAVQLPANVWRNIARYAGAHVYCESNDILLADSSVIALHSLRPGRRIISLPGKKQVRDLIDGRILSKGTREFSFDLQAQGTRVFLLEK